MVEIPEHLLRRSAEAKAKALGVPVDQVLGGDAWRDPAARSLPHPLLWYRHSRRPRSPRLHPLHPLPLRRCPHPNRRAPPAETEQVAPAAAATVAPPLSDNGAATSVTPRPAAPPQEVPEGVRPQRLLTVVKARAIQQVKATPTDKVNTWPHLMIAEFTALMVVTAALIVLSVILQAPLLELANFNQTPNPSKAPWYFLGLQELLSYYDPQIAGVIIPTITGLVGFMAVPYVDRNPSTKPSDRKFAIMLFTLFLAGSATLTLLGTLFRGPGFNFTYPWADGIWFDDLKDWVHFE